MRIYNEPVEMIKEVERDLFEMGIRYQTATVQDENVADNPDFMTIELMGYSYMLSSWDDQSLDRLMDYNNNNLVWGKAEALERLGLLRGYRYYPNPGHAWMINERSQKFWEKYIRDGFLSYSYGERWQQQIPYVIQELEKYPNTRQAIITMYDRHEDMHNWGGRDRVPCSLTYQFLLRDDKLSLIYSERSCDFIKFFSTDVYTSIILLDFIADRIGAVPDKFIHFLGSLHAFAGDLKEKNIF